VPRLLQQDDAEALAAAAACLLRLSINPANPAVPAIASTEGVIAALVAALQSADKAVVQAAAEALLALFDFGPAVASLVAAEPDVLPALHAAMRMGGRLTFVAMHTLGCLVEADEAASLKLARACIGAFMQTLAADLAAGAHERFCWLAHFICQIAKFSAWLVVAEEGAMAALLAALGSSDACTAAAAADLLFAVAEGCPEQAACVPGILEALVAALERGTALASNGLTAEGTDPDCFQNCRTTGRCALSLQHMGEPSSALASKLASTPGAVAALAGALSFSCHVEQVAPSHGEHDDGPCTCACFWSHTGMATSMCLAMISVVDGDHARGAAAAPIVAALTAALRSRLPGTALYAANALAFYSQYDCSFARCAIAAGALPGLAALLGSRGLPGGRAAHALGVLLDQAQDEDVRRLAEAPGALPTLVAAIADGPHPLELPGEPAERVRSAAAVLERLAWSCEAAAWRIVNTPVALPTLVGALTHPSGAATEPAAGAVRCVVSWGPQLAALVHNTPWAAEALSAVANNPNTTETARTHARESLRLF
jgi:hypothetical protein